MTKPIPKSSTFTWLVRAHILSGGSRSTIGALLRLDDIEKSNPVGPLATVELVLGNYPSLVANVENPPTAQDYVKAMTGVEKRCADLVSELRSLNQWMTVHLEKYANLADSPEHMGRCPLEPFIGEVVGWQMKSASAGAAMRSVPKKPTQGRKPRTALRIVIEQLEGIFMAARPRPAERRGNAPFQARDEWEGDLLSFLSHSLRDAAIRVSGTEETRLKKLREYLSGNVTGNRTDPSAD